MTCRELRLNLPSDISAPGSGVEERTLGLADTQDNDRRLGMGKENLVRSDMSRFVLLRRRSELVDEVGFLL